MIRRGQTPRNSTARDVTSGLTPASLRGPQAPPVVIGFKATVQTAELPEVSVAESVGSDVSVFDRVFSPAGSQSCDVADLVDILVLISDDGMIIDVTVGPESAEHLVDGPVGALFEGLDTAAAVGALERCSTTRTPERFRGEISGLGMVALVVRPSPSETGGYILSGTIVDEIVARPDPRVSWFEQLMDELPFAVLFKDLSGNFLHVNQRFVDLYPAGEGATRDDIIGRSDFDFLPLADAEVFEHKDHHVIAGSGIRDLTEEHIRSDGTVEFHRTTKLPIRGEDGVIDGVMSFSMEVTEPVRVAQALATNERRYRLAMRASRDGVWELDVSSNMVEFSGRAARLLHLPATNEAIPASGIFTICDEDDQLMFTKAIDDVRTGRSRSISVKLAVRLRDGELRTLQIEGAALTEGGATTRVIGSLADVTEAVENERRLRHMADHDHLTGLGNRRSLIARLDEIIAGNETGYVLLYLDLDDFKVINDSLGHNAGDELLIAVAERLRSVVRDDDLVTRVGGDEFAVLLAPRRQRRAGATVSSSILRALAQPLDLGGDTTYTSASIGILHTEGYVDSDALMRDADTAMYSAKSIKGTARMFESHMHSVAVSRHQLHSDLRRACDADQFELVYQPLVDATTHEVHSLEALIRWNPGTGLISPAEFLPALERTGMIVDVGQWVIEQACRQLATWRARGLTGLGVSINLSRVQVRHGGLVELIEKTLTEHGLDPGGVTFEVTETAIAADVERLVDVLTGIRNLGAHVAIDDFGVGQSCLAQLHEIPVDSIKIDQSFVSRIGDRLDHVDPVLEAVLNLGRSLEKRTVGEGVETMEQAEWLRSRGCDLLQGYVFARPLAPSVVEQLIVGDVIVMASPA